MTSISIQVLSWPQAEAWLGSPSERQRALDEERLIHLQAAMADGLFVLSPDMLVRVLGKTYNGQHRLAAQVRAKATCPYLVLESDDGLVYKLFSLDLPRVLADPNPDLVMAGNLTLQWIKDAPEAKKTIELMTAYRDVPVQIEFTAEALLYMLSQWRKLKFS